MTISPVTVCSWLTVVNMLHVFNFTEVVFNSLTRRRSHHNMQQNVNNNNRSFSVLKAYFRLKLRHSWRFVCIQRSITCCLIMSVCLSVLGNGQFYRNGVEDPYLSEAILFVYNQSGQCGWTIIPDWLPVYFSVVVFFVRPCAAQRHLALLLHHLYSTPIRSYCGIPLRQWGLILILISSWKLHLNFYKALLRG